MRILEMFAGIGSQRMALNHRNLNLEINESYVSEWYVEAVLAYKKIHYPKTELNILPTVEEMIEQFNNLGLSLDSKKLHTFTERDINRNLDKYISLYKANLIIQNLGSIVNEDNWNHEQLTNLDLLTYSFPCQDLSTAGNMRGLSRDSGTRSSLLWKVADLIHSLEANDNIILPRVLLMENVSVITSDRYKEGLDVFQNYLNERGYINFPMHLNATEFGSIQNRKRFFLVSIREDLINENTNLEEMIREFYSVNKKSRKNRLRDVIPNINDLPISTKNHIYEEQLQGWYDEGQLATAQKIQNADSAYPTFNQAKVVVGLDYPETPTVTFQGEFSRIRFFDIINEQVIVRRANSLVNWKLMGFDARIHRMLVRANFKENTISSLAGNSITINQLLNIFGGIRELGVWNE